MNTPHILRKRPHMGRCQYSFVFCSFYFFSEAIQIILDEWTNTAAMPVQKSQSARTRELKEKFVQSRSNVNDLSRFANEVDK